MINNIRKAGKLAKSSKKKTTSRRNRERDRIKGVNEISKKTSKNTTQNTGKEKPKEEQA
jgi:hypothetical protein